MIASSPLKNKFKTMKKLIIFSAMAAGSLLYNTANAQIRLHLGIHFGPRPVIYAPAPVVVEQQPVYEQPAPAYDDQQDPAYSDTNDDYYYLPDVNAYYDVNDQCYFYNDGDNWVSAAYLPGEYRDYDWRSARRYEVRAPRPYLHNDFYMSRYNGRQVAAWRHDDNHFGGGYAYRGYQHFDNRPQGGYDQRFNNRPQGGYNQHFDNNGQRGFTQPNRNEGGNNQHGFDNRGKGGFNQPSNQNFGRERGGTEHFAQNNQRGAENRRMSRF
jgi:hypothetical protein